jgi:DNA-binding Xre family transcriptional regulator|tara:strand:- start:407 stop:619 length:213 start_codon:yes stop_codon:yes gene_type:complete
MATWVIDRKLVKVLMIREKIPNQQELSRHSGVGYHHLSRLFAGSGWDHRTLSRLCTALKCGPQEILQKEE